MPALVAGLNVAAQRLGSTDGDVLQGSALLRREHVAVPFEESIAVLSKDLGHFELRPGHGFGRPSSGDSSRSSGLCVAWRDPAETWVDTAVVLRLRCPSKSWMVRMFVPLSRRWVAKLCLRVWTVTCLP